jgi:hypothetical protein
MFNRKVFLLLLLSVGSVLSTISHPLSSLASSRALKSTRALATPVIPRFVHIHIPKTGGVAVESFLTKHYHWDFILTWHHNYTVADFTDRICLVVVRDPIDRFISSYQYWRYGSSLFFRDEKSVLASSMNFTGADKWVPPITSIFDFIHAAGNSSHPHHDYVMHRLNATKESRSLDDSQTWGVHFQPQSFWLRGGNPQKIILLRYASSPTLFSKRLAQALNFLSLPPVNATMLPINTSRKKPSGFNATNANITSHEGRHSFPHDDTSLEPHYRKELISHIHKSHWIQRYYQSDLRLWSQISSEQSQSQPPGKHWMAVF